MNNFCLKQGEGLKASAAHLYLNFPSSTLPGVELHFEAYWGRYRFFYWLLLAPFSIRFFMVNEELEDVTWSLSCRLQRRPQDSDQVTSSSSSLTMKNLMLKVANNNQ